MYNPLAISLSFHNLNVSTVKMINDYLSFGDTETIKCGENKRLRLERRVGKEMEGKSGQTEQNRN